MPSLATIVSVLALMGLATAQASPQGMSLRSRRTEVMAYQAAMTSVLPLFCFVENGFDFVGNDIGSVRGAVDTCCESCERTKNCEAWTWTNFNSGTCWLKSAKGDVVVNANAKSAMFFYWGRPRCQLMADTNYVGNDIANVPSASADGCCSLCQNYAGCRAYSWTNQNGGTCWLKSKAGGTVAKAGVQSAQAYPVADPQCRAQETGVDYVGNDLGYQNNMPDPTRCCELCRSGVHNCRAYSWTSDNGGTCYFKSLKGDTIQKAGLISSQVFDNPDPACTLQDGVDFVGNDIGSQPSSDPLRCCSICREYIYGGCKAFSWSNYNAGTCWLKSGKGATANTAGVKSAVIA